MKRIMILLLLVVSVLAIGSVAAADDSPILMSDSLISTAPVLNESLVASENDVNISAPDVEKFYHGSERFIVTLTDSEGNPLVGESVSITIVGVPYDRVTNENGTASLALNLNPGNYSTKVVYKDKTVFSNVLIKSTVMGNDLVKYYKNDSQFYVKVLDSNGDILVNKTITFNIVGVFYTRTTNESGIARLNINLNQGNYTITAINPTNGEQSSYKISVLPLIDVKDVTVGFQNGGRYYATLHDNQGNPLANKTVTFNIVGMFYNRTTDENGTASLAINLLYGKYVITAQYGDFMASSTVLVKADSELTILNENNTVKNGDSFRVKLWDKTVDKPIGGELIYYMVYYDSGKDPITAGAYTDGNGISQVRVSLPAGSYTTYVGFQGNEGIGSQWNVITMKVVD